MAGSPIEGQVIVLTAAKASVPPSRLPGLVEQTQAILEEDVQRYRREYERIDVDRADGYEAFLVDWGHWEAIGERARFDARERAAVRRAHEEQFLRLGRRTGREEEFETALEIREPVIVGTPDGNERHD